MPYCEHCSAFNDIGVEQCIFCGNPVFEDIIDEGDDPDEYISMGKNIGIGLAFFIVIGIACGIGVFISIVASGDNLGTLGILGGIVVIGGGPIIALIVGIVQGKMASESIGGLIAGGVTGAVGYVLLMLIVLGFLYAGFAVKDTSDEDDELVEEFGVMVVQFAAILLPSAIIGAFAGFITNKYIFRPRIIFRASGWGQPPPPTPRAPPPPPPQPIPVQAPPPYQGPPPQPQQIPFPMPQPQPYPPPQQFQGPPQPFPPQQQRLPQQQPQQPQQQQRF
jgi:hypothetical protein